MICNKYPNFYQCCFMSKYGRKAAILNGENTYCQNGEQYDVVTQTKCPTGCKCDDWTMRRCQGLLEVHGVPRRQRPFTK